MRFSYSSVSCYEPCPFQFKLRYLDKLKPLPTDDAANALIIGSALHKGIETDVDTAISEYFDSYPIITDAHIHEEIKLRYLIPKVKAVLPEGKHEVKIADSLFTGVLDLLVPVEPELEERDEICYRCPKYDNCDSCQSGSCPYGKYDGFYDLYDFKYSNHIDRYVTSRQLHVYKYYFEKMNPGKKIRDMIFVFVPKIQIRQKKTEELYQFRQRLVEELEKTQIIRSHIEYDPNKVIEYVELTPVNLLRSFVRREQ